MAHITRLPKRLSYFETNGVKVLDIRQTRVDLIPRKLKGVDIVLAKANQIKYVAPDFHGSLVETLDSMKTSQNTAPSPAAQDKLKTLKKEFTERESISAAFFNSAYSAKMTCSAFPDEETHLPAGLSFHWNPQECIGTLNAGKTWLLERPVIQNVPEIIMPNLEKMQRRLKHEALVKRRQAHRNSRKDHGLILSITGGMYR